MESWSGTERDRKESLESPDMITKISEAFERVNRSDRTAQDGTDSGPNGSLTEYVLADDLGHTGMS